ncbi:MAG: cytochrome c family protein [Amaricoccus sp.]
MRMIGQSALAAALAAAVAAPALAQDAGDPAAGEKVFKKCLVCHTITPDGKNKVGPDLYGVIGRTTGTAPGFDYSEVMQKAGQDGHVWTEDELSKYLESPKAMFPGTKMTFVGLSKPEDRANVIAYIKSASSGG